MKSSKYIISWRKLVLAIAVFVLAMGTPVIASTKTVQAAVKNGLVQEGENAYYYQNGTKLQKKWVKINNAWYFFAPGTGAMTKNEFIVTAGNTYYVGADGKRVYGFQNIDSKKYYFETNKGILQKKGFITINGKKYYSSKKTGRIATDMIFSMNGKTYYAGTDGSMQRGWKTSAKGDKYYFTVDGAYSNGWYNIGSYRYHMDENGVCDIGWQTIGGNKYYFVKSGKNQGVMMKKGVHKIGSKTYMFGDEGVFLYEITSENKVDNETNLLPSSDERTIKNFLLGALQPVGNTLYVWGGGHDEDDATRKGVNPGWELFYNSQSGSYDYNNYRFAYGKGLDCSGFVGWSIYQIMQKQSGGTNYTTLAESVASANASRGFGTLYNQSALSSSGYKFTAGDLGCTAGHTWIVLGQCSDGSLVIVHATPPCVQIAGTPTPDGSYTSEAIALAQQYMRTYYGGTVSKFGLKSSTGSQYIKGCNIMRWNSNTLSDPDGYREMSADQILADLFGTK